MVGLVESIILTNHKIQIQNQPLVYPFNFYQSSHLYCLNLYKLYDRLSYNTSILSRVGLIDDNCVRSCHHFYLTAQG